MRDGSRVRMIYAIGAFGADIGNLEDGRDIALAGLWPLIALNVPGDGFVSLNSALGRYDTSGTYDNVSWTIDSMVLGPFTPWLAVRANHNQMRYDTYADEISDHRTGMHVMATLGSYIATYGLNLE